MGEITKIVLAVILMILICLLIDYLSNIRKLKRNKIRIVNLFLLLSISVNRDNVVFKS